MSVRIFFFSFSSIFLNLDALYLAGCFLRLVGAEKLRVRAKYIHTATAILEHLPWGEKQDLSRPMPPMLMVWVN